MNKLLLILFISFSNFIYAQDCEYLGIDKEFENGDIAYLFGDNVRLRKAPSFEAEALAILKIISGKTRGLISLFLYFATNL